MVWEAEASGRRGRQQTYSDAAIQSCLTFKVLFGLPLRQTTGFVESLLKSAGLDWSVPNFSTLYRRQRTLSVVIPYKALAGSAMRLCCRTCSTRSLRTRTSAASPPMVLRIRANAMTRLQPETPMQLSCPAKMPSSGSLTRQEHERATKRWSSKYLGRAL